MGWRPTFGPLAPTTPGKLTPAKLLNDRTFRPVAALACSSEPSKSANHLLQLARFHFEFRGVAEGQFPDVCVATIPITPEPHQLLDLRDRKTQ
jgi:hypothetical protein